MSEQQKREVMQVFASLPEGVRRGFAAGYVCGKQENQEAETQAPAETKDQNDNPTA